MRDSRAALAAALIVLSSQGLAATTEFCLDGEFDLGARMQGLRPLPGEFYPARFCVTTESGSSRVRFHGQGHSNPDMIGDFELVYLPPDTVRIVSGDAPPDTAFVDAGVGNEAMRVRRIDPERLVAELEAHPDRILSSEAGRYFEVLYPGETQATSVELEDGRLVHVHTSADLPLRGSAAVHWNWDWSEEERPKLELLVDGDVMFRGTGSWRELPDDEAATLWQPTGGETPREIPGENWPARIDMRLETITDGVHVVRGVRTGFHHLVVETEEGLVVADAPAGWVELPQIPPADLVPGLGVSGLSEKFVDYLEAEFPDQPIRAVALTHAHDDHAGGARAFAAAGAAVYAPGGVAGFLDEVLNDRDMPVDRLGGRAVEVIPVEDHVLLDDAETPVELMAMGPGPHVESALGIWVPDAGIFFQSDLHVPRSDAEAPREDRLETECWFAKWAVENLPRDAQVLNSHTTVRTPLSRLAKYLQTNECRKFEGAL